MRTRTIRRREEARRPKKEKKPTRREGADIVFGSVFVPARVSLLRRGAADDAHVAACRAEEATRVAAATRRRERGKENARKSAKARFVALEARRPRTYRHRRQRRRCPRDAFFATRRVRGLRGRGRPPASAKTCSAARTAEPGINRTARRATCGVFRGRPSRRGRRASAWTTDRVVACFVFVM